MTFDARMAAFLADPSITALVGARAFAVMTTQHPATPYLFWQRIATVPQDSHDATAQLVEYTVQVTCVSDSYASAAAVRAAVKAVMEGNHAAGPATWSNEQDIFSDDVNLFSCTVDFTVWHNEAA